MTTPGRTDHAPHQAAHGDGTPQGREPGGRTPGRAVRSHWANVPDDKLPAHVCPTCRAECPVDHFPHSPCTTQEDHPWRPAESVPTQAARP